MKATIAVACAILSGALAGCLEGSSPGPGETATLGAHPPLQARRVTGYEYACPAGPNATQHGLCTGRIVDPMRSSVEPYLAIHPARPDVMAIGVNAHQSTEAVGGSPPDLAVRVNSMDFYFTEDGGASWRRSALPYVSVPGANPLPVQMGFTGDPALEFDQDGVLHVSALVSSTGLAPAILPTIGVIYTSTPDLGRTWSPAVALDRDHNNDRNWITVGPDGTVFVPWQKVGASAEGAAWLDARSASAVAWSLDGGASWRTQRDDQRANGCPTVSVVVVHEGSPLLACAGFGEDGQRTGVRVYELDADSGDLGLRADVASMPCVWPQLTRLADGSLGIVGENCDPDGDLRIARSRDGARTWSEPARVTSASKAGVNLTMWFRGDPWGGVHLLATRDYGDLEHLVFDPDGFAIVHDRIVRPARTEGVPPTGSGGLPLFSGGDHYYGLAFTDRGGFMVWTRDYGLDYTRLLAVGNG